jgi:hypothetical protein
MLRVFPAPENGKDDGMSATADWYSRAALELAGTSRRQVEWASGVAGDSDVLELIDELPRERRQPSLVFSASRYCAAEDEPYAEFRIWLIENWPQVAAVARTRRTQTNEPGRCIPLLAALDRIPGPIALLEVGASAGLCLVPDRYSYRFDGGRTIGSGDPLLECVTTGVGPVPTSLPRIVWRRGIDLAPLSVDDESDRRWLEALLPPDRPDRVERLRAACATVATDAPIIDEGDALADLARAARDAPHDATLVVAALGTLVYLPPLDRATVFPAIARVGARAVTFEAVSALPEVAARLTGRSAPDPTPFLLALDGIPLAYGSPHGDRLSWLTPAGRPGTAAAAT